MKNELGKSKVESMMEDGFAKWLVGPNLHKVFPESKDCETIARFMGWEPSTHWPMPYRSPATFWKHPDSAIELSFQNLDFTTDYNLFVKAWNKAMDDLSAKFAEARAQELFTKLDSLQWTFTIELRLPILIEIINFLHNHGE